MGTLRAAAPDGATTGRRGWPIRWVVAWVVLVPAILTSAALLTVAVIAARRAAESFAATMMESAALDVRDAVQSVACEAMETSDLYAARVAAGDFRDGGTQTWETSLALEMAVRRDLAAITIAPPGGGAVWVQREDGDLVLGRVRPGEQILRLASIGPITPDGFLALTPRSERAYDLAERPWYRELQAASGPSWTAAYRWLAADDRPAVTGVGYARELRGPAGEPAGDLLVDVTVEGLSEFLRRRPLAQLGAVFIVDERGELLGSSTRVDPGGEEARTSLATRTDPVARAAAAALAAVGDAPGDRPVTARPTIDGEAVRVRLDRLSLGPRREWTIVTAIPESAILGEAERGYRRGLVLAALIAVLGGILAISLGHRLSRPVATLNEHLTRIGQGHLDERIRLDGAAEFASLARTVNIMATMLEERRDLFVAIDLATEVQQALLPKADLLLSALEVAGVATYSERTGGDYFDFIPLPDDPTAIPLLALGDVSGHGVGAALIMATARAALRAHAGATIGLDELLRRVNLALVDSVHHGDFMTLCILRIDPDEGRVSWASAGQDPIIVCRPDRAASEELEGGVGPPLGIDVESRYGARSERGFPVGTVFFLGTDGVWDMRDEAGIQLGKDAVRAALRSHASDSASAIRTAVSGLLQNFRGNAPQPDDATFLVAKLLPRR